MRIIGVTGPIGSGKSTVTKILNEKYGARVLDADKIARKIVEPGNIALNEIVEYFGSEILKPDGTLDRAKLGRIVFNNKHDLEVLNRITHPRISEELKKIVDSINGVHILVIEAPIPLKEGFLDIVDEVWVVMANKDIRVRRVMERNKMPLDEAMKRIIAQENLDYQNVGRIVKNNESIENLEHIIGDILKNEGFCT